MDFVNVLFVVALIMVWTTITVGVMGFFELYRARLFNKMLEDMKKEKKGKEEWL
jgi:hypothetical protein